jgi:hypothetical protein
MRKRPIERRAVLAAPRLAAEERAAWAEAARVLIASKRTRASSMHVAERR